MSYLSANAELERLAISNSDESGAATPDVFIDPHKAVDISWIVHNRVEEVFQKYYNVYGDDIKFEQCVNILVLVELLHTRK